MGGGTVTNYVTMLPSGSLSVQNVSIIITSAEEILNS